MLRDLLPLMVFLVAAAVVYAVREHRRRLYTVNPPAPDATLGEAWESLAESMPRHPDRALLPQAGPEHVFRQVPARLAALEPMLSGADDPRAALRVAILETAARALHLEVISESDESERQTLLRGYQPGMEGLIENAASVCWLECVALRRYAHLRFDDAVADDWFHNFLSHARPYVREKVRLARECLIGGDAGAATLAVNYDSLLAQLAEDALRAPSKKRFVPPDFPPAPHSSDTEPRA